MSTGLPAVVRRKIRNCGMYSNAYLQTLDIERPVCHGTAALILGLGVAGVSALASSALPLAISLPLVVGTVAAGVWEARRQLPSSPHFIARLRLGPDTDCRTGRHGRPDDLTIRRELASFWVLADRIAALEIIAPGRPRQLVILRRNQMPPLAWRRLRVRLRFGGPPLT